MNQRSNIHKLKKIKSIITDFNAVLTQKPYNNKIDQARTAAVLSQVLTVFWKEEEKESPRTRQPDYIPPPVIDPIILRDQNLEQLKKLRSKSKEALLADEGAG